MIYLVRHTDTVADSNTVKGHTEHDVSKKGKNMLENLCEEIQLLQLSPEKIVSSDLNRAVYTAERIQSKLASNPVLEKYQELRESGFGNIETDKQLEDFKRSLRGETREEKYKSHFPNGESTKQVCERSRQIYNNLPKSEDNIIVTHTTPIKCILSEIKDCHMYKLSTNVNHCELIPITEDEDIKESHVFEPHNKNQK